MDMLDHALESSQEKSNDSPVSDEQVHLAEPTDEQAAAIASVTGAGQTMTLDASMAFPPGGHVTYRVVQVNQDSGETAVVATPFTTQDGTETHVMASPFTQQAVIQSPFSNGGSPTADGSGETRFAYFPTVSADGSASQSDAISATTLTTGGGQFYLMMSPQDVLQGQRNLAPRTNFTPKMEARTSRDDRRRATHNEVERRRRDKINNWIVQLSKLVPDCATDTNKQGQVRLSGTNRRSAADSSSGEVQLTQASKGGILAKACDHITDLRTSNAQLAEKVKELEQHAVDSQIMRQQLEDLKTENNYLRAALQQNGINVPDLHKTSGGP